MASKRETLIIKRLSPRPIPNHQNYILVNRLGDVNVCQNGIKSRVPHVGSEIVNLQEVINRFANDLITRNLPKLEREVLNYNPYQMHIKWLNKKVKGS